VTTISRELVTGVRCDKRGCEATIMGPEIEGRAAGRHHYEALAETRGWTIWNGRTRYLRCPEHPVTPGRSLSPYAQTARRVTELGYRYCRDAGCPCRAGAADGSTATALA
jgi:hypothetical protein